MILLQKFQKSENPKIIFFGGFKKNPFYLRDYFDFLLYLFFQSALESSGEAPIFTEKTCSGALTPTSVALKK